MSEKQPDIPIHVKWGHGGLPLRIFNRRPKSLILGLQETKRETNIHFLRFPYFDSYLVHQLASRAFISHPGFLLFDERFRRLLSVVALKGALSVKPRESNLLR